jgi:hypothetical protein
MTDRDELEARYRAAVEAAIYAKLQLQADDEDDDTIGPDDSPFLLGWAVVYEFTTSNLDRGDQSAVSVIVPDTQSRATSRGVLELGVDRFRT